MSLRLLAQDADDLRVVASALQDAVVSTGTMDFDRDAQSFTLQGSRFRHEAGVHERIHTGVRIDNVLGARHRGLDRSRADAFTVLLDMAYAPADEPPGGVLSLVFAGGGCVELDVDALDIIVADAGEARPAKAAPDHG